jgi:hypothetical protein
MKAVRTGSYHARRQFARGNESRDHHVEQILNKVPEVESIAAYWLHWASLPSPKLTPATLP